MWRVRYEKSVLRPENPLLAPPPDKVALRYLYYVCMMQGETNAKRKNDHGDRILLKLSKGDQLIMVPAGPVVEKTGDCFQT